jgi:alkylhydroperoxidase/carboxymuconolactone decarboxylase family protein YurZ
MYNKSNLRKLEKMMALPPDAMNAFWAFDQAAVAEGAIPVKYKELIVIGVALTTQCAYCIDIHAGNACKPAPPKPSLPRPQWWQLRSERARP